VPVDPNARRRAAWQLLGRLVRRHSHILRKAILAGIGWQAAGIAVPIVLGWAIDHGIEDDNRAAIWIAGGAILVLGGFEAACGGYRHNNACRAHMGGSVGTREELIAAALDLDADGRDTYPPGEIVTRADSDADQIGVQLDVIGHTVAFAVSVPVVLVCLFVIDPVLAGAVLVTTVVTGLVVGRYSAVWERRSEAAQDAAGHTTDAAQETVEGFKVVRGIGAEAGMVARFEQRSTELRARATAVGRLWMVFEPVLQALSVASVAVVLWLGGERVIDGTLEIGQVVTAIGFAVFLTEPIRTLGERVLTLQQTLASALRVVDVLHMVPPPSPVPDADTPPPGAHGVGLEGRGLVVVPAGGRRVLDGADVAFEPGTLVVLTGGVGAGKTTLLAVLAGLRTPVSGEVLLGGVPLDRWSPSALRRKVVLVGPTPFVFRGTVADNLRFGRPDARPDELEHAARVADAHEFVETLPEGYDSLIGERGLTLSGGQRQRLALARAVLARPPVLLLDGATSALDPTRELSVLRALRQEWRDGLVVVVSANPGVVDLADEVFDVGDGRVQVRL
jgi:ABC-type multidrug transport system fused ATPase/permease subunit